MQFIIPILQILITFQCLFFLLYLVVDSRLSQVANRILAGLLITLSAHMTLNLINQHLSVGILPNVSIGFGFFYGPFIFLYVHALSTRSYTLRKIHAAHFIPGIAAALSVLFFRVPVYAYAIGIFISLFLYALLSYMHIDYYQKVLRQTRSEDDRITLRWLSSMLVFQIMVLVANIASVALSYYGRPVAGQWAEISLFLFLVVLVSSIILKGLQHPALFGGISEEDRNVAEMHRQTAVQCLDEHAADALLERLLEHMKTKQPYLDPSISINRISRQMGVITRDVSQVINRQLRQNFSQFVNHYRVDFAKEKLRNPDGEGHSIIDIMYDCGFNTKSNFNRAFKELTGQTPRQYRRLNDPEFTN